MSNIHIAKHQLLIELSSLVALIKKKERPLLLFIASEPFCSVHLNFQFEFGPLHILPGYECESNYHLLQSQGWTVLLAFY